MNVFLHDAEIRTGYWKRRHLRQVAERMGVWRWRGIQKHASKIIEIVCNAIAPIDFGGADGPLGFGSYVVDPKADWKCLSDVPFDKVDVIFTSHTLEHLPDVKAWLTAAYDKLLATGHLIVHVPAWTCERWQADHYNNPSQDSRHVHTFCLCGEKQKDWMEIDRAIGEAGFDIELAEHCGDDSIIIFARKP